MKASKGCHVFACSEPFGDAGAMSSREQRADRSAELRSQICLT